MAAATGEFLSHVFACALKWNLEGERESPTIETFTLWRRADKISMDLLFSGACG